ncbi:hypothetical protein [Pseudaquabacterium rugosum]|jgi:hypothetical protein|uniref:Uncharacterized protein n=1 Tax=Pseudaquabacterium rugosum TaxID=2984194 RepID=A0ABU9B925_9BURK
MFVYSRAGRELARALEDPSQWTLSRRQLSHRPTGRVYWVGSGALGFDGYAAAGTPRQLGFIERLLLWRRFRRLRLRMLALRLREGPPADGG